MAIQNQKNKIKRLHIYIYTSETANVIIHELMKGKNHYTVKSTSEINT